MKVSFLMYILIMRSRFSNTTIAFRCIQIASIERNIFEVLFYLKDSNEGIS